MSKARDSIEDLKTIDANLAAKAPLASPVFTGNVGVGVTPESDWASAFEVIQIGQAGVVWANNNDNSTRLGMNVKYDGAYKRINSNKAANLTLDSAGSFVFDVAATGAADAAISWNTAMTIDNAGIVTKPLQPAFMGLSATATNLAIQSWHTIVFSSERFDNNNDFSSNTFTAPVTGKYQMNVFIRLHSIDNGGHYYFINLNTSNSHYYHIHGANGWSADPDYHTIGSSYVIDMDAGDTAIVQLYQGGGSAQTDIQDNEGYFSGVLVA